MLILIIFAFLGGIVTILSPCILAVLPIILSGTTGGKRRPLGVVVGFVSGFTFFTLFLTSIVSRLGVGADTLRYFAIVVLAFFGLALVIPWVQLKIEIMFSKLAARAPKNQGRTGFGGGLLIGLSLGLLWTPCVGPILASVISLALTGSVSGGAILITLSYALGTALPMLIIMVGGRGLMQKVPWLTRNAGRIQQAFGVLMIITALAIVFNADKKIQAYVAERLPDYASVLTGLEQNNQVEQALNELESKTGSAVKKPDNSDKPLAPEIIPGGEWINSEPLKLSDLRGQIVMVEFLTYSCINCIRTFPYLNAWYDTYKDKGFTIVGVHTPEFEFEKDADNVRQALKDQGIMFPVVQDNNYDTWRAFGNRYWPRKYILDWNGRIVFDHIGEGAYDETEQLIQKLIAERDLALDMAAEEIPDTIQADQISGESIETGSPETYFGSGRNDLLANGEPGRSGEFDFRVPDQVLPNQLYLVGRWRLQDEYAIPLTAGARIIYRYNSRRVFLVAGADSPSVATVRQDGALAGDAAGADVEPNGRITIEEERLYRLIDNGDMESHTLDITIEDPGSMIFTFTFG